MAEDKPAKHLHPFATAGLSLFAVLVGAAATFAGSFALKQSKHHNSAKAAARVLHSEFNQEAERLRSELTRDEVYRTEKHTEIELTLEDAS